MAVIAYTTYNATDSTAGERTAKYVLDGHGNPYDFTTKYVADGHGGKLYAIGYHVPPDAKLAALQMQHYKEKYHQSHIITRGTNKNRTDIDVIQIYISFPDDEQLSQSEMMQIVDEYIKNLKLDQFAILAVPHYNTDNRHVHLVIGAYSVDGTKKFVMNKEKVYLLRRNMDYLCVEHGLSIIEPKLPLLRDPEYAAFYQNVIDNNMVPIIPRQKKKGKCHSRRKSSIQVAMDRKAMENAIREEKKRTEEVRRKSSKNYYSYPGAYLPYSKRPAYIYKYDAAGRERSVPELMLMLLATVAMGYLDIENQHPPKNEYEQASQAIYFGKVDTVAQRSMDAIMLSQKYNVKNHQEITSMRNSIGQQMNHCKTVIKHQQLQLEENQAQLAGIYPNSRKYEELLFANEVIEKRILFQENKMKELNKEYRDVSWMEKTLQKSNFESELQSMRYLEEKRKDKKEMAFTPKELSHQPEKVIDGHAFIL